MIKRILVPVDGSKYSMDAIKYAIRLCKLTNAKILLMHCRRKIPSLLGEPFYQQALTKVITESEELLAPFAEILSKEGIEFDQRIFEGRPGEKICEVAKLENIGLIVMGSRGRSDLEGLFLGSVAHRVLQSSPCPVLIVRGENIFEVS